MQRQLQELGVAGVAAYGLLNTFYYASAFLYVWFCIAKVPPGAGLAAAARAFVATLALVWGGSQVTKLPRAAAAVMLAPLVDRGMDRLQRLLRLPSKRSAFLVIVAACLSLAVVLFGAVVVTWA